MDTRATVTLTTPLWLWLLVLAVLPIVAIALAYGVNLYHHSVNACTPLLDGCVSISRAVRSSEGIPWFRLFLLPCCGLLPLSFAALSHRYFPAAWAMRFSSYVAALFLLLYVSFLGTDGEFYQWLRRLGIVFFFAGTGLAQLLCARQLQQRQSRAAQQAVKQLRWLGGAVLVVAFFHLVIKHGFPSKEPIENVTEWWLALLLCVGFGVLSRWLYNEKQT
jgi:hypothetical protein